uniref:Uncharacterized protein n=1 Tax=Anguilla anguilla TaxID=7936 RepID=A0A0E9S5Z5_ANGAN
MKTIYFIRMLCTVTCYLGLGLCYGCTFSILATKRLLNYGKCLHPVKYRGLVGILTVLFLFMLWRGKRTYIQAFQSDFNLT